jgi:hypothetical protein
LQAEVIDLETDEESDGEGALKKVKESESAPKRARRGPPNKSMVHFEDPVAISENGKKRWMFKCKYCKGYV